MLRWRGVTPLLLQTHSDTSGNQRPVRQSPVVSACSGHHAPMKPCMLTATIS